MWSLLPASYALFLSVETPLIAESSKALIHLPEPPKNILEIVAVGTVIAIALWRRPA